MKPKKDPVENSFSPPYGTLMVFPFIFVVTIVFSVLITGPLQENFNEEMRSATLSSWSAEHNVPSMGTVKRVWADGNGMLRASIEVQRSYYDYTHDLEKTTSTRYTTTLQDNRTPAVDERAWCVPYGGESYEANCTIVLE